MSQLRKTIENLATQFADGVLAALRNASLEDVYGVSGGIRSGAPRGRPARSTPAAGASPGRRRASGGRVRRTAGDIERMVGEIVSLLEKNPGGMRAEQIREALGVDSKVLPRPLAEGVGAGRIQKAGQKRATTYTLGSGGGGGRSAGPKAAAKRRGRKKRA